jgi:hypothetical protein
MQTNNLGHTTGLVSITHYKNVQNFGKIPPFAKYFM